MGCFASTPKKHYPRAPQRAVAAGRNVPTPGQYSQYHAQAEAAFRAGDVNGDGVLDAQELYGVLIRLGFFHGVPLKDCSAMMEEQMQRADNAVADRRITFDEFVPYFEYLMHELHRRGVQVHAPAAPTQFYGQPQYAVQVQPQFQGHAVTQYGASSGQGQQRYAPSPSAPSYGGGAGNFYGAPPSGGGGGYKQSGPGNFHNSGKQQQQRGGWERFDGRRRGNRQRGGGGGWCDCVGRGGCC